MFNSALLTFVPQKYRHIAVPVAVATVVVVVGAIATFALFSNYISNRDQKVSEAYWKLNTAIEAEHIDNAKKAFAIIETTGTDEQVAVSSMLIAALLYNDERFDEAAVIYQNIIALDKLSTIKDTARLRLAKVLIATNDLEGADELLTNIETINPRYLGLVANLRGDISLLDNDLELAQTYYEEAIEEFQQVVDEDQLSFLTRKINTISSLKLQKAGL